MSIPPPPSGRSDSPATDGGSASPATAAGDAARPDASAPVPSHRTRGRRIAIRIAAGVAAVVVALLLFDRFGLRPVAEHYLAERSQREVHFGTLYVSLSSALQPVLQVRDARISNASWAGEGPLFAARRATLTLAWHGLTEGRVVVERLELEDAEANLTRTADGLRNWRLTHPEDRGPGKVVVKLLQAQRSSIRLRHDGLGLVLHAATTPADAPPAAGSDGRRLAQRIDFDGTLHGAAFAGSAHAAEVLTLQQTGRAFALRGHVAGGGGRLEFEGAAADLVRGVTLDVGLHASGASLTGLGAFAGNAGLPQTRPYAVDGRLKKTAEEFVVSGLQAHVGDSDLAGDVAYDLRGEQPMLKATLQGDALHLADFGGLGVGGSPPAGGSPTASLLPKQRFDTAPLQRLDARLDLRLKAVHAGGLPPLRGLHLTAALDGGRLDVELHDLSAAGGTASGRLGIDATRRPAAWTARLDGRGLRIEQLLGEPPGRRRIAGAVDARGDLSAHGDSVAALAAQASGTLRASLRSASISNRLDALLALDGGALLSAWFGGGSDRTPLQCAQARLAVQNGVGRVQQLLIETGDVRVRGSGTVDLRRERFDLLLTPERKSTALLALDRAIALQGTFRSARASLAAKPAAAAGAGRAACAERAG